LVADGGDEGGWDEGDEGGADEGGAAVDPVSGAPRAAGAFTTGSSTNFSTTCRRAKSTSSESKSSISMMSWPSVGDLPGRCNGGTADSKISSARVSSSMGDSPAGNAAGSSASRASALKTSPHRPHRTWPPAARSTSADKRNTVSHFTHCVYKLNRSPRVNAAPIVAPKDLHHIKPGGVRGFHRVGLRFQQSGQHQVGPVLAGLP
jgi:hypothetical protein